MPLIEPFGSDTSTQTIEIGQQTFLGLTVVDINCNSSWDSQGAQCSIKLIQDHTKDQYLENVLVGTPQYFEIVDSQNNPVFRFYGILKSLSRNTSSEKSYTAVLQSPTLLLDACSLITDNFAGYGGAIEAYGGNVPSCLDFGSNNYNTDPTKIFNIQNLFGVYENDVYGAQNAGFGGASLTDEGMRIDYFSYALEQLVEGVAGITPQLGGNILYGTSAYSNGKAYAYNFDIAGFIDQIKNYIPVDYRIQATNLMDFVSDICDRINHVFYIDLLKPVGSGNAAFATGHVATKTPNLVYPNTIYGGQIVVVTQNRNIISSRKFPLSRYIISKEASDKLGWSGNNDDLPLDIGMQGSYHPDGPPAGGQGGEYPVEPITVDDVERIASSNLSVSLNEGAIAAKYVVGGYQSRINYIKSAPQNGSVNSVSPGPVPGISGGTCETSSPGDADPTADVYIYWGEINTKARAINSPNEPFLKNAPVLTPVIAPVAPDKLQIGISPLGRRDIIFIDMIEFFGRMTINGFMYDGIYAASLNELIASAQGYESWLNFMTTNKPIKLQSFQNHFIDALQTSYRIYANNSVGQGTSYLKKAVQNAANHYITLYNTSGSNTGPKISCTNYNLADAFSVGAEVYAKAIVNKLAEIYKRHYGITYAVKAPAFAIKLNPEFKPAELTTLFDYSWRPSQDGFLDPSIMENYFAPQGVFLQGGRLKAYVNYEAYTENTARFVHDGKLLEFESPNDSAYAGLEEFSTNELYFRPVAYESVKSIVSIPLNVEEDYLVIPNEYFSILYPRDLSYEYDPRLDPETVTGNKFNYLSSLSLSQATAGGIPFFLVSTQKPVRYQTVRSTINSQQKSCQSDDNLEQVESSYDTSLASQRQEKPQEVFYPLHPIGFGIPQQSTRYVYGPWVTQTTLQYATKIEVEQNTDLVPENYLGYQNMATVGQLLANSVENFDYLYTEEGSVNIPGLPKVTHLGQSLVENGPLVSDISISLTANGLETNYSMRTFAPKFGRIGKYYADKITRLFRKTL
jgi:hypothetical protein